MARRISVEVVGDAGQYERSLRGAAAATNEFGRQVKASGANTATASSNFRSMGSSIKVATGGFIAFESAQAVLHKVYEGLNASIGAAREAAVVQRALAAQMKASGESFAANQQLIDQTADSYTRFGFTADDVVKSLTVLERATGDINQSLALQQVVADLARAKNLDLAAAAAVVGKVFGGQETALRRAVPGLEKHAHGLDLIREASRKLAGQAAANTTEQEKFHASLHKTGVTIGDVLLPVMDKLEKAAAKALDKINKFADKAGTPGTKENKQVDNVKKLGSAFGFLAGGIDAAAKAADKAAGPLGGLIHLIPGVQQIATVGDLLGTGSGSTPKPTPDTGFRAAKLVAPTIPGTAGKPATVAQRNAWFDAMIGRQQARVGDVDSLKAQNVRLEAIAAEIKKRLAITHDSTRSLMLEGELLDTQNTIRGNTQQAADQAAQDAQAAKDAADQAAQAAQAESTAWASFAVEKAASTKTLTDDLAAARSYLALMEAQAQVGQMTAEKAVAVWEAQQALKTVTQQIADQAKTQKQDRLQSKIDWAEFSLEKDDATKTLTDNIRDQKKVIALIQEQIRLYGRTIDRARNLWNQQQNLKDLLSQKKKTGAGNNWGFGVWQRIVGTSGGVGGMTGGGMPTSSIPAAPGGGITINNLNLHGVQNVAQLEDELVKRSRSRPQPRRGR